MTRHADDCFALRTANPADRIALRGVRLLARLAGMSQRVTLEQTFVNLEPRAIEAVYTFPLPESAAVCGFEVVTADRVLTGTVEEAEQATEKYEEAIAEGHGAFMVEQDRPDVFTVRVGNLKPRQAATIRLTYVCLLERADKQIRVSFPTTIAPRYATATATDPLEAAVDADALNPPHVLSVPYGLTMHVEVDLGRELVGCFSPSHAIDVGRDESGKAIVTFAESRSGEPSRTLSQSRSGEPSRALASDSPVPLGSRHLPIAEMNRDVVLTLKLAKEQQPHVQSAPGPDGANFLAVTFVPEFDEDEIGDAAPSETIFVLDCSGSMMGDSIEQAKTALELCLRSLSPGDSFNICRFGSSFELMASEPLPYTQQTLDRALKYVRDTRDLGGTELHAPLEKILTTPVAHHPSVARHSDGENDRRIADTSRGSLPIGMASYGVRQIILLTDGQVTNEPAVVELCRKHRRHNRIFSFGIGSACSAFLVKGVARATGGAAEFITAGERIDEKVLRTFARLNSPIVSDVSLDWDGAEVQTLAEIPPIFDGDVMAVFARCPGKPPRQVTLSCQVGGGSRSWRVDVPPAHEDQNVISTMWARRTIQSMEEVNGPALRVRKKKLTREQDTLVRISKQFNLLCSLTTFVAIEHRSEAERNEGQPAVRRVPVMIAKGWGGIEAEMAPQAAYLACAGAVGGAVMSPPMSPPVRSMMPAPASPAARGLGMLGRLLSAAGGAAGGKMRKKSLSGLDPSLQSASPPAPPAEPPGGTGLADLSSLDDADELMADASDAAAFLPSQMDRPHRTLESLDRSIDKSLDSTRDGGPGSTPIDRLIQSLLRDAVRRRASEIHIEPMADRVQVRCRIDERFAVTDFLPNKMRHVLSTAIKAKAAFGTGEPQNDGSGAFQIDIDGCPINVGVAGLPTTHGEAFVLTLTPGVPGELPGAPAPLVSDQELMHILSHQSAEGWFGWSDRMEKQLAADGTNWRNLVEAALPSSPSAEVRNRRLNTALVLLLFTAKFADREALWRRAAKKAIRSFLSKALGKTVAETEEWVEDLRKELARN